MRVRVWDDWAILQAQLNKGGTVFLEPRDYILSRALEVPSGTTLHGCGALLRLVRPVRHLLLLQGGGSRVTNLNLVGAGFQYV